jgi:hypothetical protein
MAATRMRSIGGWWGIDNKLIWRRTSAIIWNWVGVIIWMDDGMDSHRSIISINSNLNYGCCHNNNWWEE